MQLVKAHNSKIYLEDFGLRDDDYVYLHEANKKVSLSKLNTSPVVRINALWVTKNIKIKCNKIADTSAKKTIGLQKIKFLRKNEGMYFPYKRSQMVSFHQGSVPFSLDIIFLGFEDQIIDIVENTKVGSNEVWNVANCTGVIEVKGGFCKKNNVGFRDRIALCAVSKLDIKEVKEEKIEEKESKFTSYVNDVYYTFSAPARMISRIADEL